MSFGAINAESQRDIIIAMKAISGRCNSGEGGENPFYYTHGIHASVKQVASGRFGVDAEYLLACDEIQIKIAQGAKPGEGGQLMGIKVNQEIARARHSEIGTDLISPPPLHDLYSIEDLKELIYELKQLNPTVKVSVKLVSGKDIGTIATGVAKAGADIIQISGHDGGTGAAQLLSMKHAGLPWEVGLLEVHRALLEEDLRKFVTLRVDGGLSNGREIAIATALGAEQYDFGKLLLIAEGCVMARICEKNTCPTGIATHDPKFKAKYNGKPESIVKLLEFIAEDIRFTLANAGLSSLKELVGRTDLLEINEKYIDIINNTNLKLDYFTATNKRFKKSNETLVNIELNELNKKIIKDYKNNKPEKQEYQISTQYRAVPASLAGYIAQKAYTERHTDILENVNVDTFDKNFYPVKDHTILFHGSAGQGFGVFLTKGLKLKLYGEANDSVGKAMSGGKIVISPPKNIRFNSSENTIIGKLWALYGATGGILYVNGVAGDRFAVRNSGANAIAEGTGLHACEYMTSGKVLILGKVSHNVGSGMTGGVLYLPVEYQNNINKQYVNPCKLLPHEEEDIYTMLRDYYIETGSQKALEIVETWGDLVPRFVSCVPVGFLEKREASLENNLKVA